MELWRERQPKRLRVFPGVRTGVGQKAVVSHHMPFGSIILFILNQPVYCVDQSTLFKKRTSANHKTLISR